MSETRPLSAEQEERLARYRSRRMSEGERSAFEREALQNDVLFEELYAEVALDELHAPPISGSAAGATIAPMPRQRRAFPAWLARTAIPLAAAAAIVLAVFRFGDRLSPPGSDEDPLRGNDRAPRLLEPSGTLAEAPRWLRWNAVSGAHRYRVEVYAASGSWLGFATTSDTVVAFDAVTRETVTAGEWRVTPIDTNGLDRRALGRVAFRVETPEASR